MRSKYRAKRTTVDNISFASKREAARYTQLKLLEKAGAISDLKLQIDFPIFINGIKCFVYRSDFTYTENGVNVVEDVKGLQTPMYRLKRKCVEAAYGIKIRET